MQSEFSPSFVHSNVTAAMFLLAVASNIRAYIIYGDWLCVLALHVYQVESVFNEAADVDRESEDVGYMLGTSNPLGHQDAPMLKLMWMCFHLNLCHPRKMRFYLCLCVDFIVIGLPLKSALHSD